MAKRRKFSAEYKREAVGLVQSSDKPISQVARDLGLNPNILSRWCRECGTVGDNAFAGQGKPRDEELAVTDVPVPNRMQVVLAIGMFQ